MIDRCWFERHPVRVAFDLVGASIDVHRRGERLSGRITETEAYAGPDDLASHSGRLKTGRLALYAETGRLYMYRSYGIHTMLNVVAHEPNDAGAVLIRALEPIEGLDEMADRRGTKNVLKLTVGPGVLCQALGLRLTDNGLDLFDTSTISICESGGLTDVTAGPRIGITRSAEHRWRFFETASQFVSTHRRGEVVTRDMLDVLIQDGLPQGTMD